MGLSFKEMSAWVTLILVASITGGYLVQAWSLPFGPAAFLLIKATIAIIAWEILLHILLAVRKPPEPIAQLDLEIAARASRISASVFIVGIFIVIGQALFPSWLGRIAFVADAPTRTLLLNLTVAALGLASVSNNLAAIVLYRRSACAAHLQLKP